MSIIWADFPSGQHGLYGTTIANMLNGVWAALEGNFASNGTAIVDDIDPNVGSAGKVLRYAQAGSAGSWSLIGHRLTMPATATTGGIAFRLWTSALPIGNTERGNAYWAFRTSANADIAFFRIGASGQIIAYNAAGTQVGESGPVIVANAYNHIETKILRNAAAGTAEVRVNGVAALTLTGLALGSSDILNLFIGQDSEGTQANSRSIYYKDVVFWDGSGSKGNDFQGSVAVHDLYPNADISLNWTPSTGSTGWDLIDETTPNDADYIQAGAPAPAAYVASLTDLPEDVTSVRALLSIVRAVKTDGGDCNLQISLTPNNTAWDDGANRPITTAYTYWWDVSEVSPNTLAPWTPVEVNAAYIKANRTV